MYKNILVPVSFEADRNAQGAMEIAQALRATGGTITCLHVLEQLPKYATEYLPAGHLEAAKADIVEGLKSLVDGVSDATTVVTDGHASRTILAHAENNDVDLIIGRVRANRTRIFEVRCSECLRDDCVDDVTFLVEGWRQRADHIVARIIRRQVLEILHAREDVGNA